MLQQGGGHTAIQRRTSEPKARWPDSSARRALCALAVCSYLFAVSVC